MKSCGYSRCNHLDKCVDTSGNDYVKRGNVYFHKDCYETWQRESEDMRTIKDLWIAHISRTVVVTDLYGVLREYLDRGVESAYLVFAMRYVISHHCKLSYPKGFRYYIDDEKIKKAYKCKLRKKIPRDAFFAVEPQDEVEHKHTSLPPKKRRFSDILRRST